MISQGLELLDACPNQPKHTVAINTVNMYYIFLSFRYIHMFSTFLFISVSTPRTPENWLNKPSQFFIGFTCGLGFYLRRLLDVPRFTVGTARAALGSLLKYTIPYTACQVLYEYNADTNWWYDLGYPLCPSSKGKEDTLVRSTFCHAYWDMHLSAKLDSVDLGLVST